MKQSALMVFLTVLVSTSSLASRIAYSDQGQTIYIMPDGSVVPSTPPIQGDGDVFTASDVATKNCFAVPTKR
jgi:hypothetical protein